MQERVVFTAQSLQNKESTVEEIGNHVLALSTEQESLRREITVLEKLADLFGVRGVQHFIFMSVIGALEKLTNHYLEVLADGGIKLRLEEDKEGDKIVKGVMIRGSDGEFKDRGLSQLSGGQWRLLLSLSSYEHYDDFRRVSLALDLAFAEIIRRKGLLKCNLLVMDEVLTHLDASGREAVGSVLRSLIMGSKDNLTSNSDMEDGDGALYSRLIGAGAYETVLVILQDLAAQELEEAFDHIDTVVKHDFSSTVVVDGV